MTYKDIVNKYFDAWTATGNIDDSYADIRNILVWLQDKDIQTEEDAIFIDSLSSYLLIHLADDIANMVMDHFCPSYKQNTCRCN